MPNPWAAFRFRVGVQAFMFFLCDPTTLRLAMSTAAATKPVGSGFPGLGSGHSTPSSLRRLQVSFRGHLCRTELSRLRGDGGSPPSRRSAPGAGVSDTINGRKSNAEHSSSQEMTALSTHPNIKCLPRNPHQCPLCPFSHPVMNPLCSPQILMLLS